MKLRTIVFLSFLVLSTFSYANGATTDKFIIICESDISSLKIVENNNIEEITPSNPHLNTFFFETQNSEKIEIISSMTTKIRIYWINKQIATNWISMEKDIPLKLSNQFLATTAKIEIKSFFYDSYINTPVVSNQHNLRSADVPFYHLSENHNFLTVSDAVISWKSNSTVEQIIMFDVLKEEIVFQKISYNDTILKVADYFSCHNENNFYKFWLSIEAETLKDNLQLHDTYNLEFAITGITGNSNNNIFWTTNEMIINWESIYDNFFVRIVDNETNTTVWSGTTTKNFISANEIPNVDSLLKIEKIYRLEIGKEGESIVREDVLFIIAFSSDEYSIYNNFLNEN